MKTPSNRSAALPSRQNSLSQKIHIEPTKLNLPSDGMSRWNQIAPFSPFSREKFRQLVRAGKAPQPIKFSERCTAYSNRELHRFFQDPLNYRAEGFSA